MLVQHLGILSLPRVTRAEDHYYLNTLLAVCPLVDSKLYLIVQLCPPVDTGYVFYTLLNFNKLIQMVLCLFVVGFPTSRPNFCSIPRPHSPKCWVSSDVGKWNHYALRKRWLFHSRYTSVGQKLSVFDRKHCVHRCCMARFDLAPSLFTSIISLTPLA